jgi:carbonic anhydrase
MDGNKRFVAGQSIHGHANGAWRKRLTAGQKPFAAILGCSDSRVPTELVFDQGFGDLFVIRVAGNVIATDVVGSSSTRGITCTSRC